MTQEDTDKYLDMVDRSFTSDGRLTHDGRVIMAAALYNIDSLAKNNNALREMMSR